MNATTPPEGHPDRFRASLDAVDPAALTTEDTVAMIEVIRRALAQREIAARLDRSTAPGMP